MIRLNAYSVYDRAGYLYGLYKAASQEVVRAHLASEFGTDESAFFRVKSTSAQSAARDEWHILAQK